MKLYERKQMKTQDLKGVTWVTSLNYSHTWYAFTKRKTLQNISEISSCSNASKAREAAIFLITHRYLMGSCDE